MVIFTSDHGEGLGDHKEEQHGCFIYNSTMHVPLIMSFPSRFGTARNIPSDVRRVDVFPTIIDLMGGELPPELEGQNLASACLSGEAPRLPVYGESEYPLLGFGWSPLHSLIVEDWKYIDAPRPELYDRRGDPTELINLIDEHLDVAERMQQDLAGLISQMRKRSATAVALDEEALDQLAGLGYVAGAAASVDLGDGTERKDPKDMIAVYQGFERAVDMIRTHDHQAIVDLLEPLIEQSPESDVIHGQLAVAYLNLGRFADAQRAFEASLRASPEQPGRLCGLAEVFRKQGKLQEAIAAFQRALDTAPDWKAAHSGLGALYSRTKRYALAEPHWRRCVELDPTSVNALTNLGTVLLAQRRPAEAIPWLQQAVEYDPANEFAHRSLWQALVGVGRRAAAIQALRNAREVLPDAAPLKCALARLLATTPGMTPADIDEAIHLARQCCAAGATNAMNLDTLAAAYAAKGEFSQAVETARQAIAVAGQRGQGGVQRQIEDRMRLYESGRPYVELPRGTP